MIMTDNISDGDEIPDLNKLNLINPKKLNVFIQVCLCIN